MEFDNIAGIDAAAAAAADDDLDDDEDLAIVGGAVEKNEKCPYTMKSVSTAAVLDRGMPQHVWHGDWRGNHDLQFK